MHGVSYVLMSALVCCALASAFPSSPTYDIVFSPTPVPHDELLATPSSRVYPVRQANGSTYFCILPPTGSDFDRQASHDDADADDDAVGVGSLKPSEEVPSVISNALDRALSARACSTFLTSYWNYELCWGRFLRQYHVDAMQQQQQQQAGGAVVPPKYIYLGVSVEEFKAMKKKGETSPPNVRYPITPLRYTYELDSAGPYFKTVFGSGTLCDVTGKLRRTEVHLRCPLSTGQVATEELYVEEIHTCVYRVTLYSTKGCIDGMRPKVPRTDSIVCYPVRHLS